MSLITFFGLIILIALLRELEFVQIDEKVNLFAVTGIPLFLSGVLELRRTHKLQRAEVVREHVAKLLTDERLYSWFTTLVYKYDDNTWRQVQSIVSKSFNDAECSTFPKNDNQKASVWGALESLNGTRMEGERLFHPDFFQGSIEEERLDRLLSYFDVLAYYYQRGLIDLEDIIGSAGYLIGVIGTRGVIKHYLDRNATEWKRLPYIQATNAEAPYVALRVLIEDYKQFNRTRKRLD